MAECTTAAQLDTSSSFFKAMQDPTVLPAVMDQICTTDQSACTDIMDSYAEQIRQKSRCALHHSLNQLGELTESPTGGDDLALGNALAVAALNSFQNFKLYREVACLKNEQSQGYCFAEAASAPTARFGLRCVF